MTTLLFERSLPRFAAARVVSSFGSGRAAGIGPLRLVDRAAPDVPAEGWFRVDPVLSGICGSDLATLDGRSSRYFEDIVSFPFVPGHEVVGTVAEDARAADGAPLAAGTRVVLQPVLGCVARGIEPPCPACQAGHVGNCGRVAFGHIRPGLQTGFCADTGGGWSSAGLVAHASQLYAVPDGLSDADAVTVEPVACAVHAVLGAPIAEGDVVAVLGAGTLGLLVTARSATWPRPGAAPHLRRSSSAPATRTNSASPASSAAPRRCLPTSCRAPCAATRARCPTAGPPAPPPRCRAGPTSSSTAWAAPSRSRSPSPWCGPAGTVSLVGMPGKVTVDLAPLWHREVRLAGAYAYGTERADGAHDPTATFALAFEVAAGQRTGRLVSATYPLARFEEAVAHAGAAGRRGAVKIAFDVRKGSQ